jgi:uncharacterized protein (TIGR02145 family)
MNFRDKKDKRHLLCTTLPLLVAGILSLLQLSCTSDGTPMIKDDTATIHVTFGVDKATRALSTNESTVNDVTVLVFDSNSNLVGSNYLSGLTGGGPYSMNVTARTGNCTIYAIANTGSSSYFKGIATTGDFKKKYDLLSSGDDLTNRGAVLMFGKTTYDITAGATIPSFPLTRLCTKLTFNITPSAGITVTGYRLRSVPTSSYINDDQSQTPSYNPSNNWADCTAVSIGSPVAGAVVPAFTYYMYENLVGTSSSSIDEKSRVNAAPNATYLEVYAKTLNWHSTYRIYLGGTSATDYTNFNIPRNNAYSATISITGSGQSDARVTYTSDIPATLGAYLYSDGTYGTSILAPTATPHIIGIVFTSATYPTSNTDKANGWVHGYAIALKNAVAYSSGAKWSTNTSTSEFADYSIWASMVSDLDGYTKTNTIKTKYSSTLLSSYPAFYSALGYGTSQIPSTTTYAAPAGSVTSGWYLPSIGQWYDICVNLGGMPTSPTSSGTGYGRWYSGDKSGDSNNYSSICATNINTILNNLKSYGYTVDLFSNSYEYYWSSSEYASSGAYSAYFYSNGSMYLDSYDKTYPFGVRPVVAF